MCGIAAILLAPRERPAQMWAAIRESFTINLLCNEERGKAATGLALIQANGQIKVQKMALPASQFVRTPAYQELLAGLGPQTTLLLGHTRHPTKGDPANNGNNHPLQAGPVIGIHNGHIRNDDDLFAHYGYPRQAQVDSEVIFRLLEGLPPPRQAGPYLAAAHPQLKQLQGDFTFLACDRRTPEKLLVVRHGCPLSVHWDVSWQVLTFSSRYVFLRRTFGPAILNQHLPADRLLLFDAYELDHLGHHPAAALVW